MAGLGAWMRRAKGGDKPGPSSDVPEPPGPSSDALYGERSSWMKQSRELERPDNPASWVGDEGTWEKAKAAVKPRWDEYDEPYAVVAHVYEKMGGTYK